MILMKKIDESLYCQYSAISEYMSFIPHDRNHFYQVHKL